MDIQLGKREAINMIEETNDPSIIEAVIKLLTKKKKDWWDDLSDEQKEELELGVKEFERGEVVSYESILQRHGIRLEKLNLL